MSIVKFIKNNLTKNSLIKVYLNLFDFNKYKIKSNQI